MTPEEKVRWAEAEALHQLAQQQRKEPVKVLFYIRNGKRVVPPTQLPRREPTHEPQRD